MNWLKLRNDVDFTFIFHRCNEKLHVPLLRDALLPHCIAITKILEILVASTDPATLAFCHALFDLLYIIDLSNFKIPCQ